MLPAFTVIEPLTPRVPLPNPTYSSPDVVWRSVDEPSITRLPLPAATAAVCVRPTYEIPLVVEVPPPVIRSVPSPSWPIAYRGPADVPVSVSVAVPPFLMIALSAVPGTVPELQLLPVVKLPDPVTLHDTSAARSGTTAVPPTIAMTKQALCCQR